MAMNRKALYIAFGVAIVCMAPIVTVLTWPWDSGVPAWWQFEILARLGFGFGTLPSTVLDWLAGPFPSVEQLRFPLGTLLMAGEAAMLTSITYWACACLLRRGSSSARR